MMIVFVVSIVKFFPNSFNSIISCDEIRYMNHFSPNATHLPSLSSRYPTCANEAHALVVVNARLGVEKYPEEREALMNLVFGVSGWVALVVHVLLVEVFLNGSKEEDERLKKVSEARRKARRGVSKAE
jgi:hypothetical protein